jgi:hypothetical protein
MFEEYVPYFARAAALFGQVYYACCEKMDDKIDIVEKYIPNLKAVSVSGFSDINVIGEKLAGKPVIFSRKPKPWFLAHKEPYWNELEKDLKETKKAAAKCNYEFIFRDLYNIFGDRTRLRKWVNMAREA